MHSAITGIGMVPGERDNDKVIVREPKLDSSDVYNRVLCVPEVLLPILRYVVLGEGTRKNILRIASVSHLWRDVVFDILHSKGIPAYEFKCDNQALLDWDEYFVPGKIPLGYLLPIGLQITDSEVFRPEIQRLIRRHSERVIQLKLSIYKSDLRLLHILETFKLSNLVSLKLSFPRVRLIWPEDFLRIIQSVMKAAPKLMNLCLDLDDSLDCDFPTKPATRWRRKTLDTKLVSHLVAECSDWRLEELRLCIQNFDWSSVFEWILKLSAPTIRTLDIVIRPYERIRLPDTVAFPKLTTLRLLQVRQVDGTVPFDFLHRFPILKVIHISDYKHYYSPTLFDQFFPESMPMSPVVQAFTYKGADLSESQCSRLINCLPNCIKLGLDWYKADYANKSIRQITRNMTQLKILEVYLRGSPNDIAEHIDHWTFAGAESTPEAPKLERIRIQSQYPEALSRSFAINVPKRISSLMVLQIVKKTYAYETGPYRKIPVYTMYQEFKRNSV